MYMYINIIIIIHVGDDFNEIISRICEIIDVFSIAIYNARMFSLFRIHIGYKKKILIFYLWRRPSGPTHLFNLGLAERKDCRLCGEEKEDSIHILCYCPALALKRYTLWGHMFLEPSALQNVRVGDLHNLLVRAKLDRHL